MSFLQRQCTNQKNQTNKPTIWQIILSVLGALIGVQSSKVRERDFEHGNKWWIYVITGIMLVLILISLIIIFTKWMIVSTKT